MKKSAIIVIVAAFAVGSALVSQPLSGATGGGNTSIAPGILAFGVPSSAGAPEPCIGTGTSGVCYGVPAGLLVLPMLGLAAPGTSGVFYMSVETANFSGTGSTTFQLRESGVVALQLKVDDSVFTPYAKAIISHVGAIPAGPYTGAATLIATTVVTPDGGGAPVTLTANTELWIVPPSAGRANPEPGMTGGARPQIAQMAVGFGIVPLPLSQGHSAPCLGTGAADNCYGAPLGMFVVPLNVLVGPGVGGDFFIALDSGQLIGSANTVWELVQNGNVIEDAPGGIELVFANRFAAFGDSADIPAGASAGSVTLTATSTITIRGTGQLLTVASSITVQVQ